MFIYGVQIQYVYTSVLWHELILCAEFAHGYFVTVEILKALELLVVIFLFWLPGCVDHMLVYTEDPHTYMRNQHISISFSL